MFVMVGFEVGQLLPESLRAIDLVPWNSDTLNGNVHLIPGL
jgi:hypothetical protein